MKPVAFIDLFCGMGGFTVGAINAGATCIVSVDYWIMERYDPQEACRVHRVNHPYVRVECIKLGHPDQWRFFKRMVDDYRRRGYHIHIHGSPPCQALSIASTRNAEDGMPLVLWYLDLVVKCEPDSWSMENVVPVRKKLPEGVPSVVLNSADFGVPQTRRRCYAGEGWAACPSHTKEEWVSVIEALPHLPDPP
jgi:DNA (cytosine-5)-methyltransferase 1